MQGKTSLFGEYPPNCTKWIKAGLERASQLPKMAMGCGLAFPTVTTLDQVKHLGPLCLQQRGRPMLLRRIREHAASYNWFAVAVDLLIVVLGVFLGMQVNNWNDARVVHDRGQGYRERLVADLRFNELDMTRRFAYYTQVRRFGEEALAVLEGRSSDVSDEQFLIDVYQATQISPRPFNRNTYNELLAVGGLDAIGSLSVREKVANYYLNAETSDQTFRYVTPYREIVRRNMPYFAQQSIRAHCAESRVQDAQGAVINVIPQHCALGLTPQETARAVAQLRAIPELNRDLTRHLGDVDQKLTLFAANRERARTLVHDIETDMN